MQSNVDIVIKVGKHSVVGNGAADADRPAGSAPARQEAARRELADLQRRLRRERSMGRCGHFAYDLSRHLALTQMVKRAEAACRRLSGVSPGAALGRA